jgi:hypothetical protein
MSEENTGNNRARQECRSEEKSYQLGKSIKRYPRGRRDGESYRLMVIGYQEFTPEKSSVALEEPAVAVGESPVGLANYRLAVAK